MSDYFLIGVDGGATSCRARLRDMEGNLLGEGCSGPANIHSNPDLAKKSIEAACRAALRSGGAHERSLSRVHAGLGLAGAGVSNVCDRTIVGPSTFASTIIATDAYIAWLGAHQGADGGIVILGTGSCGLGIIGDKRIVIGGYGPEISDEAGGHRMGREALRRTLWAFDGRAQKTRLASLILDRFERNPAKMISFAASATPAQYAAFAPLIFEYASSGDPLAVALVHEAAHAAADIVDRLVSGGATSISLIGGLADPLAPWLPARVRDFIVAPKADSLDGAILMARRAIENRNEARESRRSSAA